MTGTGKVEGQDAKPGTWEGKWWLPTGTGYCETNLRCCQRGILSPSCSSPTGADAAESLLPPRHRGGGGAVMVPQHPCRAVWLGGLWPRQAPTAGVLRQPRPHGRPECGSGGRGSEKYSLKKMGYKYLMTWVLRRQGNAYSARETRCSHRERRGSVTFRVGRQGDLLLSSCWEDLAGCPQLLAGLMVCTPMKSVVEKSIDSLHPVRDF